MKTSKWSEIAVLIILGFAMGDTLGCILEGGKPYMAMVALMLSFGLITELWP